MCSRPCRSKVKSITLSIILSSTANHTMSLPHLTYTAGSDATLSPAGLTQLLKHPATIPCIAVGAVSGVLAWHGSAMLWSIIGKRARHSPIPPRDRWAHDSLTTRPKRIGPSCCPILKCSTSGRIGPPTPPLDGRTNQQGEQGELGELPLWYHAWVIQRATTPKGVSWISKPWLEGLEAKVRGILLSHPLRAPKAFPSTNAR